MKCKEIKNIIAIDPDLHLNGICLMQDKKIIGARSLTMWELFSFISSYQNDTLFFLESGHKERCSTWHKGGRGAARNVGKNNAVGIIIEEFLIDIKANYKLLKPVGYSKFFKTSKDVELQTGYKGKTNADTRAAIAMCWINK
jgi:hypothetical protein